MGAKPWPQPKPEKQRGAGVHTVRVVRNKRRLGEQGVHTTRTVRIKRRPAHGVHPHVANSAYYSPGILPSSSSPRSAMCSRPGCTARSRSARTAGACRGTSAAGSSIKSIAMWPPLANTPHVPDPAQATSSCASTRPGMLQLLLDRTILLPVPLAQRSPSPYLHVWRATLSDTCVHQASTSAPATSCGGRH